MHPLGNLLFAPRCRVRLTRRRKRTEVRGLFRDNFRCAREQFASVAPGIRARFLDEAGHADTMIGKSPRGLLYRILVADAATRDDFCSYAALGRPLPEGAAPDIAGRWYGISMYDSEERARTVAVRFGLGAHIAALDLTDDRPFRIERTGRRPGHYTVWGDPDALLARVVAVTPV
jgi:hypothetical protein